MSPGERGMIEVEPGMRLWYAVTGQGPDTVVVPTTGNHAELAGLSVPGHRIVFFDLRGRGRSDPVEDVGRLGFIEAVGDIERVRRALRIGSFSALGWSWAAGALALHALRHPGTVRRLVLVSTVPCRSGVSPAPARPPAPHRLAALDQLDAARLRDTDPVGYARAWRRTYVPPLLGDPAGFERMADVAVLPNEWPWRVARSLVPVHAELLAYDWRPELGALAAPVLVVHGSRHHDPLSAAEEWVDALPDGQLVRIGRVGPAPWVERPGIFFGYVNRFLAGRAL